MKNVLLIAGGLGLCAALAESVFLLQFPLDPWKLAAFMGCFALTLGGFVGLTSPTFVRQLRHSAVTSVWMALGTPFLLLAAYLIYAFGTGSFSLWALGKLAGYIGVPVLLLLPDRLHRAERVGWRDFAAMLALGLPVSAGWLSGIWTWPEEIYFFRPLFCVCVGGYAFLVIRNLEDVGYRLGFRKRDIQDGLVNFAGFALVGIPLGIALGFIRFHPGTGTPLEFFIQLFGVYLTIAIPEELLFRGILQNFLVKSLSGKRRDLYALILASIIFGASHLHHAPVPNWRYAILAALAGMFYGNAFRTRHRLSSCALTHALVDTVWHFWF
jgi:membrane protease YdiL (CAAX protease family)